MTIREFFPQLRMITSIDWISWRIADVRWQQCATQMPRCFLHPVRKAIHIDEVAQSILLLTLAKNYIGLKGPGRPHPLTYQRKDPKILVKRKRKRSDSVLWQKPLHQQKCQKGKVTTQTTPQKSSIKQRLRTDLGRSVGVTKATQLVWLTGLRAHLPTNRNSRLIKRTHV